MTCAYVVHGSLLRRHRATVGTAVESGDKPSEGAACTAHVHHTKVLMVTAMYPMYHIGSGSGNGWQGRASCHQQPPPHAERPYWHRMSGCHSIHGGPTMVAVLESSCQS